MAEKNKGSPTTSKHTAIRQCLQAERGTRNRSRWSYLCYRVEVRFHVLIVNPVVLCWVAVENPHFVVKSVGKRGLFTPTYVTTLLGKD